MSDTPEKIWRMSWVTRPKTNDAMWYRCEDMLGTTYSFGGVSVSPVSLQCSALKHKRTGQIRLRIDMTFCECDYPAQKPLKYELLALQRMAR